MGKSEPCHEYVCLPTSVSDACDNLIASNTGDLPALKRLAAAHPGLGAWQVRAV